MPLASLRERTAPMLRPAKRRLGWFGRARRRLRFLRDGIDGISAELRTASSGHAEILREFGATVGNGVSIHAPLLIVNARGTYAALTIGDGVHLGAGVLLDLADRVTIANQATLSMRSSIITHIDVGPGPLRQRYPREQAPVTVEEGAYLGLGATILHGVTVGAGAVIGAHALVDRDVPPGATVLSPRARAVAPPGPPA